MAYLGGTTTSSTCSSLMILRSHECMGHDGCPFSQLVVNVAEMWKDFDPLISFLSNSGVRGFAGLRPRPAPGPPAAPASLCHFAV